MHLVNKNDFIEKSTKTLGGIYDMLFILPKLNLKYLQPNKTALVIVDMINGFAREGALSSPRVEELIPDIAEIIKKCDRLSISRLAFADCHTDASPEFDTYPVHCKKGTCESEIVNEIKELGGYTLITKNSTNGFHEEKFKKWLDENQNIDTFIITGDCTDICIQQFATTLKTWFNMNNKKVRVIVPINAVDTYDLGLHDGDLIGIMSIYNMITNGIDVVKDIE